MVGTKVAKVSDSGYILKTQPAALASGLMAAKYLGNWELAFSVMGKTGRAAGLRKVVAREQLGCIKSNPPVEHQAGAALPPPPLTETHAHIHLVLCPTALLRFPNWLCSFTYQAVRSTVRSARKAVTPSFS